MKNRKAKHKPLGGINQNKGIYIAEHSRVVDTVVRVDSKTLIIKHKNVIGA